MPSRARAQIEKWKIWLVLTKPYCLSANHNPEFRCVICTSIALFAMCNTWTALRQSEWSNFVMYITVIIIIIINFVHGLCKMLYLCKTFLTRLLPAGTDLGSPNMVSKIIMKSLLAFFCFLVWRNVPEV